MNAEEIPLSETPQISPETPADPGSLPGNLFNLIFEPRAAFERIFVKPRVLWIILLQLAIGVGFSSLWLSKVDAKEFMRLQMEKNPRVQQMPTEQVNRIIEMQAAGMKKWGWAFPLIGTLLIDVVLAGIFLFVFRFFIAADVRFVQSLAVAAWSFLIFGIVHTPILMSVMAIKDDWNVDPNEVVQANPTLFFEATDLPRWLWGLLGSLDLFSFWVIFLMATGYAVASKRGLGTCLWAVGVPWALWVFGKAALIAVFS